MDTPHLSHKRLVRIRGITTRLTPTSDGNDKTRMGQSMPNDAARSPPAGSAKAGYRRSPPAYDRSPGAARRRVAECDGCAKQL